jgi:probable rRNA maturation factor
VIYFNDLDSSCRIKNRKKVREWMSGVISSSGNKLGDVGVIICSDDYLLNLNNQYLDHNYYTDIITFDYTEKDVIGGDLFISYDRVKENAKQEGVLIQHELRRVMVHGVLHLLGLRDKTDKEAKTMRAAEDVALKMFHVEHSK